MKIGDFVIDGRKKAFIVAEIAQAHDGSLGQAHSYIDAVSKAGADAIKFQTHIAEAESTIDEGFRTAMSSQDQNRFEYWKRVSFTTEQWLELSEHSKEKGLIFLSSAFSEEAVNLLAEIGMPAWKLGSGEVFNYSIIDLMIMKGGPILLSTGMSSWNEIIKSINYILNKGGDPAVLQCTTKYPTPLKEVGLNVLKEFKEKFNIPYGISDHSGTPWPSLAALALEIDLLEVHVTFDRSIYGPDSSSSLNFSELSMICQANNAFSIMRENPVDKDKTAKMLESTKSLFTKSLSPKYNLAAGTKLTKDMLTLKKPSGGFNINQIDKVIGKKLKEALPSNKILMPHHLE
ncbi:MAG: N-acetylneuraminate synthase family protein [Prochlorococcus marinus CUG1432]|uniref:N-acetylneuraminate synthase family protein n=1 Tax=Prochlorococcus marinus TaxID=1219 RepID=UPI001AD995D4|nr:N-acetylneuraminate synthase family protein [Prochlorococcus marinus CUG1432]